MQAGWRHQRRPAPSPPPTASHRAACDSLFKFFGPNLSGAKGGTGPLAFPKVTNVPLRLSSSKSISNVSFPTPSNTACTPRSMPSPPVMAYSSSTTLTAGSA